MPKDTKLCEFDMSENGTVTYSVAEPFDEERFIYWNFVNSDKELLEQAKVNWSDQNHEAFHWFRAMKQNMFLFQSPFLNRK